MAFGAIIGSMIQAQMDHNKMNKKGGKVMQKHSAPMHLHRLPPGMMMGHHGPVGHGMLPHGMVAMGHPPHHDEFDNDDEFEDASKIIFEMENKRRRPGSMFRHAPFVRPTHEFIPIEDALARDMQLEYMGGYDHRHPESQTSFLSIFGGLAVIAALGYFLWQFYLKD